MALLHVVSRVLLLKILLAFLAGLAAYEFGYHPSAEEFDNLLRETRRTWTRDLLANERRRVAWPVAPSRRRVGEAGASFVPKYNYEKERNRYTPPPAASSSSVDQSWPHRIVAPSTGPSLDPHDQQSASSNTLVPSNIGSTLDFNMFSDEEPMDGVYNVQPEAPTEDPPHYASASYVERPSTPPTPRPLTFQTFVPPAFDSPAFDPPGVISGTVTTTTTTSITTTEASSSPFHQTRRPLGGGGDLHRNHSTPQLPIFFTNPATGIVYAITEVGRVQDNRTSSGLEPSDSIPIYITKEQYDRDLFLLRKHYERKCRGGSNGAGPVTATAAPASAISASSNTTVPPQIIRLKAPPKGSGSSAQSAAVAKLPFALHKPPPVMVHNNGDVVSDQVQLPTKTQKKKKKTNNQTAKRKKSKKKNKKRKRRPVATRRPPVTIPSKATTATFPKVVVGTRPSLKPTRDRISTQLEKPAAGVVATIFSSRAPTTNTHSSVVGKPAGTRKPSGSGKPQRNHRVNRRSVTNVREAGFQNSHNETLNSWRPAMGANNTERAGSRRGRRIGRGRGIRRKHNRSNRPAIGVNGTSVNQTHVNATQVAATVASAPVKQASNGSQPNLVARSSATKSPKSRKPAPKGTKSRRRPESTDSDYDYDFGLFEDSEYDSASDSEEYYEDTVRRPPAKRKEHKGANPISYDYEPEEEDFSDLKEDVSQGNSSSAEEGADYGAMDAETATTYDEAALAENDFSSSTKKNEAPGKKRIRRRPASSDAQYYDDGVDVDGYDENENDDQDEDDDYGDVRGFFRMLFYPIQMLMGRLFGGEADASGEEAAQTAPTYTFYNNVLNKDNPIEAEGEDEQPNSFGGWFGSWFGLSRRTKKIGSTTAAPPATPPSPTEAPGWFDSWFGGGGGAKTTTEASLEDYDDDGDKWFFGWFDSKPKPKRRRSTTTTTPTSVPQVPILTIVDPMRNPQNWIGILAHHIVNTTTSTSTHNPLFEAITRATSTTTANPDVPRRVSYEKYQIWRLKPQDASQVKALEEFQQSDEGARLQWLRGPTLRGLTDVLVPPKMLLDFQGTLDFESIAHEVLIFDVGKAIAYERAREPFPWPPHPTTTRRPDKHRRNPPLAMTWSRYHEYDDIVRYLETLRLRHPQMIELLHIGRSYEGRPLVVVKIEARSRPASAAAASVASSKKLKRKRKSGQANAVFIEAGTHGAEWIGPATSTWMIGELVRIMKSNKTDPDQAFVRNTTWYILPVLNPDGYVYSHEYDRFWKKTRSRHVSRPSDLITSAMTWLQQRKAPERVCYGVDLDRNWSYQWGQGGSSKSPCSEFYAGPLPFSEPESKALSEFLVDYRKQIKLYISMQAYGQILSYPAKANASFNAEKLDDLLDVAMVGTDGLRKRGSKSRYKIDSTNDLIENRSGCSDAFAAYEVGVPFAYTMQLADNGVHGYLLPSSSIESTARDAFEIILSMADYI